MCTNRALVDSLECCMDDLVECFEDFVKKSIIVISVAVGILIGMIAYVLKTIADRTQPVSSAGNITRRNSQNFGNRKVLESNFKLLCTQDDKGTCTNPSPCAENKEEKVLKDIGLSGCSKLNCGMSPTRPTIPTLGTDSKKCTASKLSQKISKIDGKKGSCCSMCCEDRYDR